MTVLHGDSINVLYASACELLVNRPDFECAPRGIQIKECTDVALVLSNPYKRIVTIPDRGLSLRYLVGELSFYFSGSNNLSFISHYSRFWNKVTDDGETVNSAYGRRLLYERQHNATQFDYVVNTLLMDRDSRKAVMVIYRPGDSKSLSNDNPCTMSLQFLIRNDELHLTVYMRSNDIWFGTPYDVAFFTWIQEKVLVAYNNMSFNGAVKKVEMGTYTHIAGSLHCYGKDWNCVTKCASRTNNVIPYNSVLYIGKENTEGEMPRMSDSFDVELPQYLNWEQSMREGTDCVFDMELLTDPVLLWMVRILSDSDKGAQR